MQDTVIPITRRRWAVFAITLAVFAAVASGAAADPNISLVDLKGQAVELQQLTDGRPTLLVFWATWCGPCRAEIPRINEAHRRFGDDGLAVLAVNPGIRDSLANVRLYVEHFGLQYAVYFDPNQATRSAYELIGTPTIILLDAAGREIQRGDTVDLQAIERLMNANPAEPEPKSD
ncbi:MAG: TlpA family protein disulfide reductase [Acidobacteria bacterium]|nr:TlpA family protein disulfide reductase [Acidobacteriota bacterium]